MSEGTRGFFEAIMDGAGAVMGEAIMPAMEKLIPQGASEVAQGLFNGNAFVPYGPTNEAVAMESPPMSISEVMNAAPPEVAPPQQEMGGIEM